jgi:anti-anti-sigma factor
MKHRIISEEDEQIEIKCIGSLEKPKDIEFVENYLNEKKNVSLDMQEVTYINSCGFGALVEETMNFSDANLKVFIHSLNPQVRKTMEILGGEVLLNFSD